VLMRRRLELLFLDAQRARASKDDSARSDEAGSEAELDPALEALVQRIIEQERRCNAIARCWRKARRVQ